MSGRSVTPISYPLCIAPQVQLLWWLVAVAMVALAIFNMEQRPVVGGLIALSAAGWLWLRLRDVPRWTNAFLHIDLYGNVFIVRGSERQAAELEQKLIFGTQLVHVRLRLPTRRESFALMRCTAPAEHRRLRQRLLNDRQAGMALTEEI